MGSGHERPSRPTRREGSGGRPPESGREGTPRPETPLDRFVSDSRTKFLNTSTHEVNGDTTPYFIEDAVSDTLGGLPPVVVFNLIENDTTFTPKAAIEEFGLDQDIAEANTWGEVLGLINHAIIDHEMSSRHPDVQAENRRRGELDPRG